MMVLLTRLISAFALLSLVAAGLVCMFSPQRALQILKRSAVVLMTLMFGIPILIDLLRRLLGSAWFVFLAVGASVAAYLIRESRLARKPKLERSSSGNERIPIMPGHFRGEDE
jgi:Ca2+/Na+ antiporter